MKSRVILIFLFLMAYIPVAFGKGDCNPDSTKFLLHGDLPTPLQPIKEKGLF
ncbi:hypothetical protein ES705_10803 [subsurface metagenome]